MLAQFGFGVFMLTFLLALFSASAAVIGYFNQSDRWVEVARRSMLLTFPLLTLAVITRVSVAFPTYQADCAPLVLAQQAKPVSPPAQTESAKSAPGTIEQGNELLSGGRYDDLLKEFGTAMPAVGFSFSLESLAELL